MSKHSTQNTEWGNKLQRTGKRQIETTCVGCGITIFVWKSRYTGRNYCSKACKFDHWEGDERGYLTVELPFDEPRFWRKAKIDSQESCWIWQNATNGVYPKYSDPSRQQPIIFAHRYVEEKINGPFEHHIVVCHRCDNPLCVNPAHLFRGTHRDNALDAWSKGRGHLPTQPETKKMPNRPIKMTHDIADAFRAEYEQGSTMRDIARRYECSPDTVSAVIHRKIWTRN